MCNALALLELIAGKGPVTKPLALVVAHPDDETIAAAGSLARLRNLTLIHVTDGGAGSPEWLAELGCGSAKDYMAWRRSELDAALQAADARPRRRLHYGYPDGDVAGHLAGLVQRLCGDLLPVDGVITHPYEGGHVDHDAIATAVQAAGQQLLDLTGRAPVRLEFASYFKLGGDVRTGEFWPDPTCAERCIALGPEAVRRKEAAFACHFTQQANLRFFSTGHEAFRIAPSYDLSAAPPPEATVDRARG